jgi:hypothetical protein
MPKSYRALQAKRFPLQTSYRIPAQDNYLGIEIRDTTITRQDLPIPQEFSSYYVHHEMLVEQLGRAKGVDFSCYVAPFEFYMYFRGNDKLLLIQTQKKVCASLVSDFIHTGDFDIEHLVVNFDTLQPHITYVKGAWFKFKEPDLRASAHFGNHVNQNPAYQEALQTGELSSLFVLHDFEGVQLQIQITSDCAIVLYPRIDQISTELSVVSNVLNMLNTVHALSIVPSKKTKYGGLSVPDEAQKTKSLGPLFEELEENEQ